MSKKIYEIRDELEIKTGEIYRGKNPVKKNGVYNDRFVNSSTQLYVQYTNLSTGKRYIKKYADFQAWAGHKIGERAST